MTQSIITAERTVMVISSGREVSKRSQYIRFEKRYRNRIRWRKKINSIREISKNT